MTYEQMLEEIFISWSADKAGFWLTVFLCLIGYCTIGYSFYKGLCKLADKISLKFLHRKRK